VCHGIDEDGNSLIAFEEFRLALLLPLGIHINEATAKKKALVKAATDKSGTIEFEEFARLMHHAQTFQQS